MLPTAIFSLAVWAVVANGLTIDPRNEADCPVVCIDQVSKCDGKVYSACLPQCSGQSVPTVSMPSCPPAACPTVCIDKVNECGMRYGGCAAQCPGQPDPIFPSPTCPPKACPTVCIDKVNECGKRYGNFLLPSPKVVTATNRSHRRLRSPMRRSTRPNVPLASVPS